MLRIDFIPQVRGSWGGLTALMSGEGDVEWGECERDPTEEHPCFGRHLKTLPDRRDDRSSSRRQESFGTYASLTSVR